MRPVIIKWFDATSCESEPSKPMDRTNVGFLITETDDYVVLSKEIRGSKHIDFLTIPKVLVKTMVELYEYWEKKGEKGDNNV